MILDIWYWRFMVFCPLWFLYVIVMVFCVCLYYFFLCLYLILKYNKIQNSMTLLFSKCWDLILVTFYKMILLCIHYKMDSGYLLLITWYFTCYLILFIGNLPFSITFYLLHVIWYLLILASRIKIIPASPKVQPALVYSEISTTADFTSNPYSVTGHRLLNAWWSVT